MTETKVTPDLEKNGTVIENGVSNIYDTAIDLRY